MKIPASYHQERLWFIDKFENGYLYESSPIYHNIPLILNVKGPLHIEILEKSIQDLINRHEALRTRIVTIKDKPYQVVDQHVNSGLSISDLTAGEHTGGYDRAISRAFEEINQPFVLHEGPLIRGKLIRYESERFILAITIHHIIADRYSINILLEEIFLYYKGYLKKQPIKLPDLSIHYTDFSRWQRSLPVKFTESLLSYWESKLSGKLQALELPLDRPRALVHTYQGKWQTISFPKELGHRIKAFNQQEKIGNFITLLAAFKVLLYRYTGHDEIVVGINTVNRDQPGLEKIIGPISNLLVIRNYLSKDIIFRDFIPGVDKTVKDAYKHQYIPFDKLALEINPDKDMSRTVFFDVLFQYEDNLPPIPAVETLKITTVETNLGWGKYDLNILIQDKGEFFSGILVYNSDIFNDSTISRMIEHYLILLKRILENPARSISSYSILTDREKNQLLIKWNRLQVHYPENKTIHELFTEQAARTPDNIAVKGPGFIEGRSVFASISYRQLNNKSDRLAELLRSRGVKPDSIVGIMMESSIEMIIAILAVLKAGGAYLPIDPTYPHERVKFILEDCEINILLKKTRTIENDSFTTLLGHGSSEDIPRWECHVTPPRPQITHLEALHPVDRTSVNYEKYSRYIGMAMVKHSISLQGTRGCPYHCAYCHKIWPKKHVYRSAGDIFNEVHLYYRQGVRRFVFIDDIFNINIENSRRFFQMIIDNGLDLQIFFPNGLRGDVLTKDFIDLMVKAGTVSAALALETASPRLQKLVGKNLNLEKLLANLEYLCKYYPHVILELFVMHGFPTETEEEAMQTLDFIKSLKWLHFPYFHILKIYPSTDMAVLAQKQGISAKAIAQSANLPYHELPDTLPFDRRFTLKCQADFFNNYFMSKERLLHVMPYQMKILNENEMVQKYNSYLPVDINSFPGLLEFAGIKEEELELTDLSHEDPMQVPDLNLRMKEVFQEFSQPPSQDAMRILLLDLSQFFNEDKSNILYDVVEPPLGLMYLMTALKREFGSKINGKIAKSRIDFDNHQELKQLLEDFKPDLIGLRTLTYYKDFFHRTAAMIRHWGIKAPLIAGGPYATSDYPSLLKDKNINLVVRGEGEHTLCDIVSRMFENNRKLPGESVLQQIPGIAYAPSTPGKNISTKIDTRGREIIMMDELMPELAKKSENQPGENLPCTNQPTDTAYVIYTSGTTGKPKGVMIEHRNVVRLMVNDRFQFDFNKKDTWTMFHSYCFDFSVWEMYGALLYGGKLILIPNIVARDTTGYLEVLKKEQVTVLNQTPSAFYNLVNEVLQSPAKGLQLKYIIFGGEVLKPVKLKKWEKRYPGTKLVNMFGITETTVHVTYKEITHREIQANISNIGTPIPTLSTYIMDRYLKLVPIGVAGELCVAGCGIGRGYLNHPELTALKFTDNPYIPRERLYRSGDLVRMLDQGEMEYLGRMDHQVKIRGFRIETGEIETQLLTHKEIKEAVVIARETGEEDRYLCAYYVPGKKLTLTDLKEYLADKLPHYMIPAYFVPLKDLPLTPNGKIDRKSLPDPGGIELESGVEYMAPRNEVEKMLVETWQDVLGRDGIGIHDNFFDIGGDSIKTIQIASRIKKAGYEIHLKDMFEKPQISGLAPLVRKLERIPDQGVITGTVSLTPIQHRFFKSQFPDHHHFNQAVMYYSQEGFEEEAVKAVFLKLQEHHDALRMTYRMHDGEIIQENHGLDYPFSLRVFDYRQREDAINALESMANQIQASIDLKTGPLMKLGLFHLEDGDRLLIVIHHLVIDGVSWRILFEDIETLYQQYKKGPPLSLPLKTDSYKEWSARLSQYADSESFLKEKAYWKELESLPLTGIENDLFGQDNYAIDMKNLSFRLSEIETGLLLTKVHEAFGTGINDILLTALGLAIKSVLGINRFLIALEGHGREEIIEGIDISRTVGWFTSLYPVLLNMSYENNLSRQIKEVKESLRQVPRKGIGYGILKYLTSSKNKSELEFKPEPRVIFNYLGQFDTEVEQKSFTTARESTGNNISPKARRYYELNINGITANRQLRVSISYNKKQFKAGTIETLLEHYKNQLNHIISHCCKQKEKELTPSDLTYKRLSIDELDQLKSEYEYMIEDIYPLSPLQEGIFFHYLYDKSFLAYFEQISYRMHGDLNIPYVEKSLNELLKRHDILRTVFIRKQNKRLLQVVLKERKIDFLYEDISTRDDKNDYLIQFREIDKKRSFDLSKDILMRVSIFKTGDREYGFTWSFHHILMDGWCLGILISEFFKIYQSFLENRAPCLPEIKQYKTYIQWIEKQDKKAAIDYWGRYLSGYEKASVIPQMNPRLKENSEYKSKQLFFSLEMEKTTALKHLASKNQVTLNTIMESVWGILLGRYNYKQDVIFGIVVSVRPPEIEGIESMVGLLINSIPLRIRFTENTTFNELLRNVQKDVLNMTPYQYISLAEILSLSPLKQNLLQNGMVFENYPSINNIDSNKSEQGNTEIAAEFSKIDFFEQAYCDFYMVISPGDQLEVCVQYNSNAFKINVIKKVVLHINEIINQVIENNDTKIKDICLSQELLPATSSILQEDTGAFLI